jgi:hypothetical protein
MIRQILDYKDKIIERIEIHRSYQAVFSTNEGKRVLSHILKHGYATESTFVQGDPEQTMLNEGSRRLALSILKLAVKNHEQIIQTLESELKNET